MGYCSLTDRLLSSTHLPAMILALKVLPVPGGPSNRTARGRLLSKRDRVFRAMTSYTSCQARRDKTQRHPRYMTSSVLWYWMSYYFEIFLRTPYRTVYITPPCGGFPSSIARQPRGGACRTTRLRKALGEMRPTQSFSAPTPFKLGGTINHGTSAEGCVMCTVVGCREKSKRDRVLRAMTWCTSCHALKREKTMATPVYHKGKKTKT